MKVVFSLAFVMFALALSCGGSSSSTDGPVTDQTLTALSSSFCDRLAACYGDFFVRAFLGDVATCKSRLDLELKGTARGPGAQVLESQGQACKRGVDAATCSQLTSDNIPECDLKGTLADGAPCAGDSQCTSGACFVADDGTCGKCAARAAEGADCTSAKCQRGFSCSAAKKCVKRLAEGGTCDINTTLCEVPLSCIGGKCGKGLSKDAACKTGQDQTPCDSTSGLYCRPPTATTPSGTCTPFTLATTGQACGVTLQPQVDYAICQGSDCVGASGTSKKGTCQAHLSDGATCDATAESNCQFPAKCRNGKCALLDPGVCK